MFIPRALRVLEMLQAHLGWRAARVVTSTDLSAPDRFVTPIAATARFVWEAG